MRLFTRAQTTGRSPNCHITNRVPHSKRCPQIRPDRQCLLWSATWPDAVDALARELLHNPAKVVIAGAGLKASRNITQSVVVLDDDAKKFTALGALLERHFDGGRLLVFCGTKKGCDALTRQLRLDGWPAMAIHGDKCQTERDWVLRVRSPHSRRCLLSCGWLLRVPLSVCRTTQTRHRSRHRQLNTPACVFFQQRRGISTDTPSAGSPS